MPDTVIFDLDGTLANIEHRLHLVRSAKPDWRSFYKSCINDTANEWCAALIVSLLNEGFIVKIVSARDKSVEQETREWISEKLFGDPSATYHGDLEVILLRTPGDSTKDDELKKKWLDSVDKGRILFVVDDRSRVVDMWRANGLVCLQCEKWEEYKRPKKAVNMSHGHVRPNSDGSLARCGGPGLCDDCSKEFVMASRGLMSIIEKVRSMKNKYSVPADATDPVSVFVRDMFSEMDKFDRV